MQTDSNNCPIELPSRDPNCTDCEYENAKKTYKPQFYSQNRHLQIRYFLIPPIADAVKNYFAQERISKPPVNSLYDSINGILATKSVTHFGRPRALDARALHSRNFNSYFDSTAS